MQTGRPIRRNWHPSFLGSNEVANVDVEHEKAGENQQMFWNENVGVILVSDIRNFSSFQYLSIILCKTLRDVVLLV